MDCLRSKGKILVFAGSGGQGIVLLTKLLGNLLVRKGYSVISTETHGMATRGGSVLSFMKVGGYKSPFVLYGSAHIGVVLDDSELEKVEPYLLEDALLISPSKGHVKLDGIKLKYSLPYRSLNIIAFGILSYLFGATFDEALEVLASLGKVKDENKKFFGIGYKEGMGRCIRLD